jgi:hypothetical protein
MAREEEEEEEDEDEASRSFSLASSTASRMDRTSGVTFLTSPFWSTTVADLTGVDDGKDDTVELFDTSLTCWCVSTG